MMGKVEMQDLPVNPARDDAAYYAEMKQQSYVSLEQENKEGGLLAPKPTSRCTRPVKFAISAAAVTGVLLTLLAVYMMTQGAGFGVGKQGAGLLLVSDQKVLLLLRNSNHNDSTWGLPGGNLEAGDTDLLQTATREAVEEMGAVPEFVVLAEIATRRGKVLQKHFTVFVCNVSNSAASFEPQLNEEHRAFKWFNLTEAAATANLHPVVALLFRDPARKQLAAAVSANPQPSGGKITKRGAGLFLLSERAVLLLQRNSSNNNATWAVPGGNVDLQDKDLMKSAKRECVEELGSCPEYSLKDTIVTRRGKHAQKEFTIFLGTVELAVKQTFKPVLSHESLAWAWIPLEDLENYNQEDLHPVTAILLRDNLDQIRAAADESG